MAEPTADGYRIDYDDVDVEDLMRQVRARAQASTARLAPGVNLEELPARVRRHLQLDDESAYDVQRLLDLAGPWNVTPEDLRGSGTGLKGRTVGAIRAIARPFVKAIVNLELPLYKQFKINLGMAQALHELLRDNAALRNEVTLLERRLEELERSAAERGGD